LKLLEYLEYNISKYNKIEKELRLVVKGSSALEYLVKAIANGEIEDIE
jgi:hypothetical protein